MIWRCPKCRSQLDAARDTLRCRGCEATYEQIDGIPDLRVDGTAWIDWRSDQEEARRIARDTRGRSVEEVVRHVFESQPAGRSPQAIMECTRRVVDSPKRLGDELAGWLHGPTTSGTFLDLGCGPGMLLAAGAAAGRQGIGLDVSMVWLVVARAMVEAYGGRPILAAGFAESLPLADGAVGAVVSLDVIEHVADPRPYLAEIDRVTETGGWIALSTPNRYSLAPEPHVNVWGVGLLPRPLQRRYAEWRSGIPYAFTRLLSTWEMARLVRAETHFQVRLLTPTIPEDSIAHDSPLRARLARVYNWLTERSWSRAPMLAAGAFFQVLGQKAGAARTATRTAQAVGVALAIFVA